MHTRIEPYLAMVRNELATSLKPRGDDNAMRIARHLDRVLIQLMLQSTARPALQRQALAELDGLLDELNALLRSIDGGMVLGSELIQRIRNIPDYSAAEPVLQRTLYVLSRNPGTESRNMVRRMTAIVRRMEDAVMQASLDLEAASKRSDSQDKPALDEKQIAAFRGWLRRRFPTDGQVAVGAIKEIVGGGSKKTLIIDLDHTARLPGRVVVRADQRSGVVESTVVDEYQPIAVLHDSGVPVPEPLALEQDVAVLGSPFLLMTFIEGRNIGDQIQCYEPSESFGLSLARAMGRLHSIPPERFGDRIAGAKTSTLESVRREVAIFETTWRNSGYHSIALELAFHWLHEHMHLADGPRALNHCDIGCHNMLVNDGVLSAWLDWETTVIGNPARDLAYIHPMVTEMMPWQSFLAEYRKAGGPVPGPGEFDFYCVWTRVWRLPFLLVAGSFIDSGLSTSVVHAYGRHYLGQRGERNLLRLMEDIHQRY